MTLRALGLLATSAVLVAVVSELICICRAGLDGSVLGGWMRRKE